MPRPAAPPALTGGPLAAVRWAAEFEALRDAVEATEPRPTVHLLTLGPAAEHTARLGFARGLFAAGGIATVVAPAPDGGSATKTGPASSGGDVACLCGADAAYTPEAVQALRDAGITHVWLAGKKDVGADGRLFAGCDALAVLRTTADLLGVSR